MLNLNSLNAVNGAKYARRFVKPLYDTYCFSALPQTVEFLLTGEGERVLPRDCFGNLPTRGITSYVFQHESYTPSTFSDIIYKGATVFSFKRLSEALSNLVERVIADTAPITYYFLYFDKIDAICHTYGPQSRQFEETVDTFLRMMEELF